MIHEIKTDALYLKDTYLFNSQACIVDINQDERGLYLILDQTIFYPQGGGQPCDQGTIINEDFILDISAVRFDNQICKHYYFVNITLIQYLATLLYP